MLMDDIFKWLGTVATAVGLPGVLLYWLRDRRTGKAGQRKAEAEAAEAEGVVASKVRKTSVLSVEAEIAALSSSFAADRKVKEDTIEWLTRQLAQERRESAAKDKRIRELETKVAGMAQTIDAVREELSRVTLELKDLQGPQTGK